MSAAFKAMPWQRYAVYESEANGYNAGCANASRANLVGVDVVSKAQTAAMNNEVASATEKKWSQMYKTAPRTAFDDSKTTAWSASAAQ